MRRNTTNTRYTVVGLAEAADLFGTVHEWNGDDTVIGHRAVMETAHDLMQRTVDATGSIYAYAFVRDNQDGVVVADCDRAEKGNEG